MRNTTKPIMNVQNLLFFILFFTLSNSILSAKENVYFSVRDSLKTSIQQEHPQASVSDFLKLSAAYWGKDYFKAIVCTELAAEKAKTTNDNKGLYNAYRDRGYLHEMQGKLEDALQAYRKALKVTDLLKEPSFRLNLYNDIAITYRKLGQYKMTKDYHLLAFELAEQIEDRETVENSYHGIGFLYETVGDYDEAIRYYLWSLEVAEERKAEKGIIVTMQNISKTYLKNEDETKAIETIQEAYRLAKMANDTMLIANVLHDYGEVLKDIGDYRQALEKLNQALVVYQSKPYKFAIPQSLVFLGDVYIEMEEYDEAESYFMKALDYEDIMSMNICTHLYNELGKLYLGRKQIQKAEVAFLKALEKAEKNNLKKHSLVSYENLYKIYAKTDDYQKALNYLEKVTALKHDILSKEKSERIAQLQFKYDVAKGERALDALELRQNKLILGGSSILFLIVIGFLVYTNRIKAKNNTNLVHKNEEIQHQNIKLKESNEVLQQFAYVAAHDLKEPLRSIGSFVNLLQRKHSHNFNEEAQEYMNFVRSATLRMNNLVTALLEYSTISIQQPSHEMIDINKIVQDATHNLQDVILTKHGVIDVENLPKVSMSPLHATQLFQNLMGNALKFSEENPIVTIRGWEETDKVIFSIKDNGIGMDESYSDKVYKLFHQLNKQGKVEGTGIGLTICKNIVDKYNGKIWFTSKEQQGTQFFISFPKAIMS